MTVGVSQGSEGGHILLVVENCIYNERIRSTEIDDITEAITMHIWT